MTGREQPRSKIKTVKEGNGWMWVHPMCPFERDNEARYSYSYDTQSEAYRGALAHLRVHGGSA